MRLLLFTAALCSSLPNLGTSPLILVGAPIGARQGGQPVNADAKAMADFKARVDAYIALHKKIRSALPRLPEEATPEQIDKHQRLFAQQVTEARKNAKPGDIFTPAMQVVARRLMERLFQNTASRRELRDSVMDENPAPAQVKIAVNSRYPDEVPLSTMPPDVLKELPLLPEELEYRFVGETLILLDPHPHIVVDFVTRALPR
jgi:hypothetical protein